MSLLIDKHVRADATGRRKNAIARVWIKRGTGQISINAGEQHILRARIGLSRSSCLKQQNAGRIRRYRHGGVICLYQVQCHGISRALTNFEPSSALWVGGFMTRDPRVVERKTMARAAADFQFSKRRFVVHS